MNKEKLQKGNLVEEWPYYTSKFHKLIGVEDYPGRFSLNNIGKNGENLTIAILSMNNSSYSLRLMDSIAKYLPNFSGEFLIGDICSKESEKFILREHMKQMPYPCRMVEFDSQYGVASGRNKLFSEVQTDWIMSLDNALYFTGNPLEQAQKDINSLGVQFLAMPFRDENNNNAGMFGGNLFVEDFENKCSVEMGSIYGCDELETNNAENGFLCTAISGMAAIMNKSTFYYAGGFDDRMFSGFEDTEFSIRIFQKGFKIGCCATVSLCFAFSESNKSKLSYCPRVKDKKYDEAVMRFENKIGFSVPNGKKHQNTGASNEIQENMMPKVLLVVDRPGWAFDHIADEIIANLSDRFVFKRIYGVDIDNFADVLMLGEDCQIIYTFWRGHVASYWGEYVQKRINNLGITEKEFHKKYIAGKSILTAVYDHLCIIGPESEYTPELFIKETSIVTNYAVSSNKLWKLYNELPDLRLRPDRIITDGVNLKKFYPVNLERFQNIKDRKIRVGWVGNSNWLVSDLKGINTIIKPAIAMLQKEGYDIELVLSDKQEKLIPHYKMKDFYAQIDCYVCASFHEGTPNPVLEAMACGIPVISTDVGVVSDCLGELQKKFILQERSFVALAEKLRSLLEHRELFQQLSLENLESIKVWDWRLKTEIFAEWFRSNC